MTTDRCPYRVGDYVRFTPSERTRGLYQDIQRFGIAPGKVYQIISIKDGLYLYFEGDQGGWPWNEFSAATTQELTTHKAIAKRI